MQRELVTGLTMTAPDARSRERLGWEQPGSKLTVCLPSDDQRTPMVGHNTMVEALPPLNGQTVPTFPHYVKPSGADLQSEGYIAKSEVKSHAIGARGTKGTEWKRDNAVQNELLKDRREKWWRSKRMEKAAKRGNPWGTQMTLREVKVRIPPKGETSGRGKEAKQAAAYHPVRRPDQRGLETESFRQWFRLDRAAKSRSHRNEVRSVKSAFAVSNARQEKGKTRGGRSPTSAPGPGTGAMSMPVQEKTIDRGQCIDRMLSVNQTDTGAVNERMQLPSADLSAADLTSDPSRPHLLTSDAPSTSRFLQSNNNNDNNSPTPSGLFSQQRLFTETRTNLISKPTNPQPFPLSNSMAGTTVPQPLIATWRQRPFLDLHVKHISRETGTYDIWLALNTRGYIEKIELWPWRDPRHATVRFR